MGRMSPESDYEPARPETQPFHSSDIQTGHHLAHKRDGSQQRRSKRPELEPAPVAVHRHGDCLTAEGAKGPQIPSA